MGNRIALTALVPGSFDPPTKGHRFLVRYAAGLFDRVIVCGFVNAEKNYLFTPSERIELLEIMIRDIPGVTVDFCDTLLADYAREHGVDLIVKGVRDASDLQYEEMMAEINRRSYPGAATVYIPCPPELAGISSTEARRCLQNTVSNASNTSNGSNGSKPTSGSSLEDYMGREAADRAVAILAARK